MKIIKIFNTITEKIKNHNEKIKNEKFLINTTLPIVKAICKHSSIFEVAMSQIRNYFKECTMQTKEFSELTNKVKASKVKKYRFKDNTKIVVEYLLIPKSKTKNIIIKITKIKKYKIRMRSKWYTDKSFSFVKE
jgi:uncharacterized membrane protein